MPAKRKRSDFASGAEFEEHKTARRKAKEREHEFKREVRDRSNRDQTGRKQSGRARPGREREQHERRQRVLAELEARENARMVRMGIAVPVGRKSAPRDCFGTLRA